MTWPSVISVPLTVAMTVPGSGASWAWAAGAAIRTAVRAPAIRERKGFGMINPLLAGVQRGGLLTLTL